MFILHDGKLINLATVSKIVRHNCHLKFYYGEEDSLSIDCGSEELAKKYFESLIVKLDAKTLICPEDKEIILKISDEKENSNIENLESMVGL